MSLTKIAAGLAAITLSTASLAGTTLSQNFDNVAGLFTTGWVQTNNSSPVGASGWFQGLPDEPGSFPAQSGATNSYAAVNYLSGAENAGGAVSNWLISPTISLDRGSVINFFVQVAGFGFLDKVEVRVSTNGASTNVGTTAASVGDFSTLLSTYSSSVTQGWVAQSLSLAALNPGQYTGRLAFRYVIGDTNVDGNYLGIDTLSVVPEPASLALVAAALCGLALSRRRA